MKKKSLLMRILAVFLTLFLFSNVTALAAGYDLSAPDGALAALNNGDLIYEGDTISDTTATDLTVHYYDDYGGTLLAGYSVSSAPHTVLGAVDVSAADPGGDSKFAGWWVSNIVSGTSSSLDLIAYWEQAYRVTYNLNGGSGTIPVDDNLYLQGEEVTLHDGSGLSWTGHTFLGWATEPDATVALDSYYMDPDVYELYAVWAAVSTYTVTYDGNGSDGGSVPVDGNNYTSGAEVTVLGNTGSLTRSGFTFSGWSDGTNTYTAGDTFIMGSADVTLSAVWSEIITHTVTYDGNGSDGGSVPVDGNNYTSGAEVTVLGNTGSLTRSGFTFSGWSDGTNTYTAGDTFIMGTADVTLHAVWTAVYTVTYDGNGSDGGSVPVDGNNYTSGAEVTVPGNTGSLTRSGFTFSGWSDGTNTYTAGDTFIMGSADVTLSAVWSEIITYTVTYDGNGSDGGSVPVDGNNYTSGAEVTVPGNTGSLTRSGFSFSGWSDGTNTYTAGDTFIMGSADVTLSAVWEKKSSGGGGTTIPSYTLSYDSNGAISGSVPASKSYTNGSMVTVCGNTGSLAKSGCRFSGWNTRPDGSGTDYAGGSTFTMGSSNVVLYAKWEKIKIVYDKDKWGRYNYYNVAYSTSDGRNTIVPTSYYYEPAKSVLYKTPKAGTYDAMYSFVPFDDITDSHWASGFIWFLSARKIVNGMGNGLYDPEGSITRAQFIKILTCMTPGIDLSSVPSAGFLDVSPDDWYAKYIDWGYENNIVFGYGNGCFGPNDPITREQMCCMIARYCRYLGYELGEINGSKTFSDQDSISSWALADVDALQKSGLIEGDGNNIFNPRVLSTRAQAAAIACRFLMGILDTMVDPESIPCS